MSEPNMQFLGRNRKAVVPGDTFVVKFNKLGYIPGKVLFQGRQPGESPMPDALMVAFYNLRSVEISSVPIDPRGEDLLIPPVFTNKLGWTRGFFQPHGKPGVSEAEDPSQYWFLDVLRNQYRNVRGAQRKTVEGVVGSWGLASYLMIDDLLSDALRVSRAPK